MKRLGWIVGGAIVVALGAVVALVLVRGGGTGSGSGEGGPVGPYAAMTQTRDERVPGTLGLRLAPPPQDFVAGVTPEVAYERVFQVEPQGPVTRTLAIVQDTLSAGGGTAGKPAWVFFVRGVCWPQDKGDTVSPSRSGLSSPCGKDDLSMATIDASTGKDILSFTAVDQSEHWVPAIADPSLASVPLPVDPKG